MLKRPRPFVLIILDGFGYREETDANAIAQARKPHWNNLWQHYPHTLISGSGRCVGLPEGQMGNSEVGHLNLGAGRVVYQDSSRVDNAILDGSFASNPVLLNALDHAKKSQNAVHILGLLSAGGVHSHEKHLHAMVEMAARKHGVPVYVHAFLDGRDTPPKSALNCLKALDEKLRSLNCGRIASIIGRYYAMDRDNRWERTQAAYELLTENKAAYRANSVEEALLQAYARGETDEFVQATAILSSTGEGIKITNNDVVIFMNYRADRARQLSRAFVDSEFSGFPRKRRLNLGDFVTLTCYAKDIEAHIAFPQEQIKNGLGEYLSQLGLRQLRIAETEKYAHVTFFFNGGIEPPLLGEDRILISSAKVATYDLKPEMSANELTDRLVEAINSEFYDVIIGNYANPDMVGHTGNFSATVEAIETIDQCLGRIIEALEKVGGETIITADHGNAECMFDYIHQQPMTAHTTEPVPLVYFGRAATVAVNNGTLSDVAPTILYLLQLPQPSEMTGKTLFQLV